MQIQGPKISAAVSVTLLIIGMESMAKEDNIIFNKTIIGPGSIVTGNTGIIIDGKRYTDSSSSRKLRYHSLQLSSPIQEALIHIDGTSLIITNGSTLRYPEGLHIETGNSFLKIEDVNGTYSGGQIFIASSTLNSLRLQGDGVIVVKKPLSQITVNGDSTITIEAPIEHLLLQLRGDSTIYVKAFLSELDIRFTGDLLIEATSLNRLRLQGVGDALIQIPSSTQLETEIDGDIQRSEP